MEIRNDVSVETVAQLVLDAMHPIAVAGLFEQDYRQLAMSITVNGFTELRKSPDCTDDEFPKNIFAITVYLISVAATRQAPGSRIRAALTLSAARVLANMEAHPQTFFHKRAFPSNEADALLFRQAKATLEPLMKEVLLTHPEWKSLIVVMKETITFHDSL